MECIEILKQVEKAWQGGFITAAEYHSVLDADLRVLYRAEMTVSTYNLTAGNGRHIRKATMVTLDNGKEIKFMDKMSKSEAIRNVKYQLRPQYVSGNLLMPKTYGAVSSQGREWVSPCCDHHYPIQSDTPFMSEVTCRCGKNYDLQFWGAKQ